MPPAPGWTPERDRCPKGCTDHGTCHQEEGRCDCPRGRTGPDCSQPLNTSITEWCLEDVISQRIMREQCVNSCNQRGSCINGFCHCFPGYYGADCSISMDWDASPAPQPVLLQGLGYEINPRGPKIFVYEFPPQYNVWNLMWVDRPNNMALWERILSLRLRTLNPEEADYFFLPGCLRGCSRWRGKFEYILQHYGRYWERRGGKDHIVTAMGDWGRCEINWVPQSYRSFDGFPGNATVPSVDVGPLMERVTVLHHWGLTADRTGPINKTVLASVAGSLCGAGRDEEPPCKENYYSFGVRGALWLLLRDKPGFQVVKRSPNIIQLMTESVFCFTPTGAGYGKRNVMATTLGCIPVVISDHVAQPWEPFLDWNSFGVWIPEADMNATEAMLRAFTPEEKAEKMRKLHCAAMHLTWSSVFGSVIAGDSGAWDAVATLVWILRARARNPGVPDHRLREVDPDFDAFMDCRTLVPGTAAAGAASPPMPNSAQVTLVQPAAAAAEAVTFPRRTFTTAAWAAARAASGGAGGGGGLDIALPGLGSDPRAGATEAAPGGGSWVVVPGGLNLTSPLCLHQHAGVVYTDPKWPVTIPAELRKTHSPENCLPRDIHRPGLFFAGGSATCTPGEPVTNCAVLV
ncbi:hypothetical protein HYH03_013211 [Edaphochlamys debaryana]|uniref:EGF-like domain-containing protein n=1 Tax=Edaphochlamys debaryana TaxID=47281 RepID=A0A836BTL5_9CHLO|nr:hypothetical protein HYH03_013211 [Edaphochlamys debaryana]|eukprot:KAG2488217.1 hypothetical protein HYH03_013211 [Edaphochlamys debaryana]